MFPHHSAAASCVGSPVEIVGECYRQHPARDIIAGALDRALVVDNLKVHHANKVKAWVQSHRHQIELVYLPAYAPEHNPDEYLNNDVKQKLRQKPPGSKDELLANTRTVMRAIQRSPTRVRGYFRPDPVKYAAAQLGPEAAAGLTIGRHEASHSVPCA